MNLPGWVDHLEYGLHPFSPSCMKGTPAEGLPGEDRMVWMGIDWCGNVVAIVETDLEPPEEFDYETQRLLWKRDEGFVIQERADLSSS